jgi:transcriptional regulator with XRE-family HTH domain
MAKSFQTLRTKMSSERRAVNAQRTQQMIEEIALKELRQALNLTQEQVASLLEINQAAVSKMEQQSDMYISTLQKLVQAMGGKLKLVASFSGREVVINQFEEA